MSSTYGAIVQNVTDTMTKTTDATLNRSLSEWFRKSGFTGVAKELRLSKAFTAKPTDRSPNGNSVLGSGTQTVAYWEKILTERPDYRDGYIAAAKSALSENDTGKAMTFITQALQIDPNDKVALTLMTLLSRE